MRETHLLFTVSLGRAEGTPRRGEPTRASMTARRRRTTPVAAAPTNEHRTSRARRPARARFGRVGPFRRRGSSRACGTRSSSGWSASSPWRRSRPCSSHADLLGSARPADRRRADQEADELRKLAAGNDPETGKPFGTTRERIFEVYLAAERPVAQRGADHVPRRPAVLRSRASGAVPPRRRSRARRPLGARSPRADRGEVRRPPAASSTSRSRFATEGDTRRLRRRDLRASGRRPTRTRPFAPSAASGSPCCCSARSSPGGWPTGSSGPSRRSPRRRARSPRRT